MADNVINPTAFFDKTIGVGGPSTDFHRGYLFQVILQKINNISNENLITYFVSATSSPVETTGVINVDWMNSQIKIGGRTTYTEWQVTVRDDANSIAYEYFRNWRKLVYETNTANTTSATAGQSSIPNQYKFSIDLFLLNNKGDRKRGYQLVNAWPTTIGAMTLDYATDAIITFPITIQFDEYYSWV